MTDKELELLGSIKNMIRFCLNTNADFMTVRNEEIKVLNEMLKDFESLEKELKPYKLWDQIKQDMVESMRGIAIYGFHIQYIKNSRKYFGSEMAIVRGETLQRLQKRNSAKILKDKANISVSHVPHSRYYYLHFGHQKVLLTNTEYYDIKEWLNND